MRLTLQIASHIGVFKNKPAQGIHNMDNRLKRLMPIGVLITLSAPAWAQATNDYIYGGPNYVNQSATSCRAQSETAEKTGKISRTSSSVAVSSSAPTAATRLFCPLQRRNSHPYYAEAHGQIQSELDDPALVQATSVTVHLRDGDTASKLSCFTFVVDYITGQTTMGTTKYACATNGGCASANVNNSFTGTTDLTLPFPTSVSKTVNFGYACDVHKSSTIYYAEAVVTPNQ